MEKANERRIVPVGRLDATATPSLSVRRDRRPGIHAHGARRARLLVRSARGEVARARRTGPRHAGLAGGCPAGDSVRGAVGVAFVDLLATVQRGIYDQRHVWTLHLADAGQRLVTQFGLASGAPNSGRGSTLHPPSRWRRSARTPADKAANWSCFAGVWRRPRPKTRRSATR